MYDLMDSSVTFSYEPSAAKGGYRVRVSGEPYDAQWDAFLNDSPSGHFTQTSMWARLKAVTGWKATRIVVTRNDRIIAGAQVLTRTMPFVGTIGYIPKGPIFDPDDSALYGPFMSELHRVAVQIRVRYINIQPPNNGDGFARTLPVRGFRPGKVQVAPTATVLIDLRQNEDALLADMRRKTRRYIRLGLREGVVVREGAENDLPAFYGLLEATGRRQGFRPYPQTYFSELWRIFRKSGNIALFLSEYKNETVSAQLVIPFGDTVVCKSFGWSGLHGNLGPNHVLDWSVMLWAKERGYRYYDMEGIDPDVAMAILHGDESISHTEASGPTFYKLGFGGRAALFPGPYERVYSPLFRFAYFNVYPTIQNRPIMKKILNRLLLSIRGSDRGPSTPSGQPQPPDES